MGSRKGSKMLNLRMFRRSLHIVQVHNNNNSNPYNSNVVIEMVRMSTIS